MRAEAKHCCSQCFTPKCPPGQNRIQQEHDRHLSNGKICQSWHGWAVKRDSEVAVKGRCSAWAGDIMLSIIPKASCHPTNSFQSRADTPAFQAATQNIWVTHAHMHLYWAVNQCVPEERPKPALFSHYTLNMQMFSEVLTKTETGGRSCLHHYSALMTCCTALIFVQIKFTSHNHLHFLPHRHPPSADPPLTGVHAPESLLEGRWRDDDGDGGRRWASFEHFLQVEAFRLDLGQQVWNSAGQ